MLNYRHLLSAAMCTWMLGFTFTAQAQTQCESYLTQCTCAAPCLWNGSNCQSPPSNVHACDDGTLSGTPSLVAPSVVGATATAKFQSLVNKKLACCANSFDPTVPGAALKYDCVDNSAFAAASFDDLWTGADSSDVGGQDFAVALSANGSGAVAGKPFTGFYTATGVHCDDFSEFGGSLQSAKVNPAQSQGQSNAVGSSACAITRGTYSVNPPTVLGTAIQALGKSVPYDGTSTSNCTQAANMRRCPILVRAAMIATCPRNPVQPLIPGSYKDSTSIHCMAAASIRFVVRIEQLYEIAGFPPMATIDTYLNSANTSPLSLTSLLQSKIGNGCPANYPPKNGTCMGCPAGCGSTQCNPCPANTFSTVGATQCTPCPAGHTSLPGSSACI